MIIYINDGLGSRREYRNRAEILEKNSTRQRLKAEKIHVSSAAQCISHYRWTSKASKATSFF